MMTRQKRNALGSMMLFSLFAALLTTAACEKDGPMERAGEEVDEAVSSTGDKAEEVIDDMGVEAE